MGGYFVGRYMPLENVAKDLKARYPRLLYWPAFILHFIWYRAFPKIPWLNALYFWSKISWLDTYFSLTKGRNRVLSKVEVWGRLSYCGMQVIAGIKRGGRTYTLLLNALHFPSKTKGHLTIQLLRWKKWDWMVKSIRTHKIRTMFPFSEFLQKRIFEDHGLARPGNLRMIFGLLSTESFSGNTGSMNCHRYLTGYAVTLNWLE